MVNGIFYESPIGLIYLEEEDGKLTKLLWERELDSYDKERAVSPFLKEVCRQLDEYFAGKRRVFEIPLRPEGTTFQKKVWDALCTIPYGEVKSYGDIAKQIGNPKASRAVGGANNKNPISIIVPCHRVIGANGTLVGYGGGLDIKSYLLELEREYVTINVLEDLSLGGHDEETGLGEIWR